jgi:hypothetical protein
VGAPSFVIFKGWGFRFQKGGNAESKWPKIPTLAKTARMGHPRQPKTPQHTRNIITAESILEKCFAGVGD